MTPEPAQTGMIQAHRMHIVAALRQRADRLENDGQRLRILAEWLEAVKPSEDVEGTLWAILHGYLK